MNEPALVLADEPTGNLDRENADQVFDLMTGIQRETGTTFLISTHDRELAERCRRRVYLRGGVVVTQTRELPGQGLTRVVDKTHLAPRGARMRQNPVIPCRSNSLTG
jgi:ABC-type multidrug transport system ATPase subunit